MSRVTCEEVLGFMVSDDRAAIDQALRMLMPNGAQMPRDESASGDLT